MITINPETFNERENYHFLTSTIIPRPVAFITTINENGVVNGAPYSYFNIISANPPLVGVSIQHKNGGLKDTARNIKKQNEFVIHIVDEENVDQINKTATNVASNVSEIDLTELTLVPSKVISVPGIVEAKMRIECVLDRIIGFETCDLFIGKVVAYNIDNDIYQGGTVDSHKIGAISRLAGHEYAKIGTAFEIKRPV